MLVFAWLGGFLFYGENEFVWDEHYTVLILQGDDELMVSEWVVALRELESHHESRLEIFAHICVEGVLLRDHETTSPCAIGK